MTFKFAQSTFPFRIVIFGPKGSFSKNWRFFVEKPLKISGVEILNLLRGCTFLEQPFL